MEAANPDLADIIVTYIKETWPDVDCSKLFLENWADGVTAIRVNGNNIGITVDNKFASWSVVKHQAEVVASTDKDFFDFVHHAASVKGNLRSKNTSSGSSA